MRQHGSVSPMDKMKMGFAFVLSCMVVGAELDEKGLGRRHCVCNARHVFLEQ